MKVRHTLAATLLGMSVAACVPPAAARGELTIYAAASLRDAVERARDAYEAANPDMTLTISTHSSAALATQIEQGAPADVFLSADPRHPQALAEQGLTEGDPVTFAANELTIIVPTADRPRVASPRDLAGAGVKIIAAGDEVPITRYAMQLVDDLAREPGYPADLASAYAANIVSREDNVRAVVAKIELGEGDAGIVYVTDAMASDRVASIHVPESANQPVTYLGVVVKGSGNVPAAMAFLDWLAGPAGQAILAEFGFLPPASS